jgi:aromatic ring-opening dioxygenase LigB subunit
MIEELQAVGSTLYTTLDALNMSSLLIISSDLAHTHSPTGPYGYSKAAKPFDEAVVQWGETMLDFYLLSEARVLVDSALSCGWTGLVLLNGFLKGGKERGQTFVSQVDAYSCPTYYGMMVARFFPVDEI